MTAICSFPPMEECPFFTSKVDSACLIVKRINSMALQIEVVAESNKWVDFARYMNMSSPEAIHVPALFVYAVKVTKPLRASTSYPTGKSFSYPAIVNRATSSPICLLHRKGECSHIAKATSRGVVVSRMGRFSRKSGISLCSLPAYPECKHPTNGASWNNFREWSEMIRLPADLRESEAKTMPSGKSQAMVAVMFSSV